MLNKTQFSNINPTTNRSNGTADHSQITGLTPDNKTFEEEDDQQDLTELRQSRTKSKFF